MNKIACAIMVSLSGICLLKGETVPQKTEWKGGRLIYDGVIIKISSICLKKESNTMMRIGCPMTSWTPPLK